MGWEHLAECVDSSKAGIGSGSERVTRDTRGDLVGVECSWAGHLHLAMHKDGIVADGIVMGVAEGRSYRVAYEVRCDGNWRVRVVRVGVPVSEVPGIDLLCDGQGNWTRPDGGTVPELRGVLRCGHLGDAIH